MNTTFKILWFEDEFTWYNMERLRVVDILTTHYLIPSIVRKDGDDFNIHELIGNDYDLILMDFKLANGVTGDTIVSALRENDIITDILFYSSEEEDMLEAIGANMPPIDGVYLTKRDYEIFTEKIKKIIRKIVRRSEDVVNLRGFVLDNTSDFELRIKEILNICWQKFDVTQQASLTVFISDLLDGKRGRVTKQVEAAKAADNIFTYANNDEYMLSVADRLDILQKVLSILFNSYHLSESVCPKDFKDFYMNNVNIYRNRLGHIRFDDKTIHIKGNDVEIDQHLHRLLRKNIADVDYTINQLEKYITVNM